METRWPNTFVVGAPRCGTSTMYHLLRQHPDVFMSPVKEPFYFAQDLDFPRGWVMVKEQGQYLNLFSGARGEARSGEASPFYLYSDHAAQEIKRRCPDPRVIIMLRNPPDMMYSLYCLWRFSGLDPSPTFEVALDNESPGIPLVRRYRALAHYPDHVTRYLTHLGRSHVHVVVFDDLVANPENTYRDVCAFLDIDSTFRPALSLSDRQRGASRAPRLRWVPRALSAYGARWGRPRRWWPGLHGAILRVNAIEPAPMAGTVRTRILREFAADSQRLAGLTGRSFTRWLDGGL